MISCALKCTSDPGKPAQFSIFFFSCCCLLIHPEATEEAKAFGIPQLICSSVAISQPSVGNRSLGGVCRKGEQNPFSWRGSEVTASPRGDVWDAEPCWACLPAPPHSGLWVQMSIPALGRNQLLLGEFLLGQRGRGSCW